MPQNLTYTYPTGPTVAGIVYDGELIPAYYLPNGTLWPAGFYGNGSQIMPKDCTFPQCNLEYANQQYIPSLAMNVALAALFGVMCIVQIPLGIRYRTWGFTVGAFCGLVLEVIGYVGRIMLNSNPFDGNAFIIYLCCLTIAPAFLTASIYLCLGRIISVYGSHVARFRPFVYTVVFMISDFFSLVLQGAGGGIASTADDKAMNDVGINIMIAGLVFQVVSLLVFMVICVDLALSAMRKKDVHTPQFRELRNSLKFKVFLAGLAVATVTIFIRSIYRVAELQAGFDSNIANNEMLFLGLEGIMLLIACICLTVLHPGLVYGRENWAACNFKLTQKKGAYADVRGHKGSESLSDTEMQLTGQGRYRDRAER